MVKKKKKALCGNYRNECERCNAGEFSYCMSHCFTSQGSKLTLANSQMRVILIICKWEKCQLAKVFRNLSSKNHADLPNIWKQFASDITSLLVEKLLLAKLCKRITKLASSPVWPDPHPPFPRYQKMMRTPFRENTLTNLSYLPQLGHLECPDPEKREEI